MKKGSTPILQSKTKLVTCQLLLLVAIFLFWWLMTKPGLIPPFMFQDENQAAFFFGEPVQIGKVIWDWFAVNLEIYPNLPVFSSAFGSHLLRRLRRLQILISRV